MILVENFGLNVSEIHLFTPTVYEVFFAMKIRLSSCALAMTAVAAALLFLLDPSSGQCVTCSPSHCEAAGGGDDHDHPARSATFPVARSHGMPGKQGPKVGGRVHGRFPCSTASPSSFSVKVI